jgi:hypothetical protein
MILDWSIDDMLPTKLSATEVDESFSASFDAGESLNTASLTSLPKSGLSLGTRPSTRAGSVFTLERTDESSEPSSTAPSVPIRGIAGDTEDLDPRGYHQKGLKALC